MTITALPEKITMRKCPGCGYIEAQLLVDLSRFNYPCRCGKYNLNDFLPFFPLPPTTKPPGFRKAA
jgi:hypothetical protein